MQKFFVLLALSLLIYGCSGTQHSIENDSESPVDLEREANRDDPRIASILEQYRTEYDDKMGVRVAEVAYPLEFGSPESALGNMAADAIRFRAAREARRFIHLSVIGESSFRLNFNEGTLTLGEVLEFMPYENHLVLLKLTGEMVHELSQQIAARGGAPVSGMRFRLVDGRAQQVLVNSEILDRTGEYWLATSNWVANGGDDFTAILNPLERIDYELSIRDLYVDYFRNQRTLSPEIDGRIRE
ncbi:hypothetical protein DYD21_15960 [Rhodohalobacter sp. SW132]|uniref:5'-nucleotidase C-terminal domain-containing protein n=1 Tax=Rhodohalobacter sp. SW132 TaxID=2293433 RepID=UPI000E270237|nr:5'-nucleotidase C-terminal domain-containing protein [Rhodohalobacter sp. SW132]REL25011.1 hypothetical protein DYD21_15960 [Rhodohalobacter sp. SW132]